MQNSRYGAIGDAKEPRQLNAGNADTVLDANYLSRMKFGIGISFATSLSSLANHIGGILLSRSYAKMIWVYTQRDVANVHHYFASWDRPVVQFIRESMGAYRAPSGQQETTIAAKNRPSPQPTFRGLTLSDMTPEEFLGRRTYGIPVTGVSAEFTPSRFGIRLLNGKRLAAVLADAHDLAFGATLCWHRESSSRCRAGSVKSTARHFVFRMYKPILPSLAAL